MYRSFGIFGLSAALFVAAASCSRMQSFELSGRIDGLQVGDTLRFERVLLPEWNYEPPSTSWSGRRVRSPIGASRRTTVTTR